MYKTQAEVEAALAERYAGPTERRKGFTDKFTGEAVYFTYIPWEESVKQLNAIFGVFGWSVTPPVATYGDGYWTVSFGLSVRVANEDGEIIEKTVPCVDSAEGGDSHGAKKAMSGALVKGSQLLGDAFGFYIGPEAKAEKRQGDRQQATKATSADGNLGFRPSEKQITYLRKYNIPFETMTGPQWKAALDAAFEKAKREPAEITF